LDVAATRGNNWSEQCAMIIMQSYMYSRSTHKNCHTGARLPSVVELQVGKAVHVQRWRTHGKQRKTTKTTNTTKKTTDKEVNLSLEKYCNTIFLDITSS
jgi:hypothetical protein